MAEDKTAAKPKAQQKKGKKGRKLNLTPAQREKRREQLAERRAAGKMGPEFGKLGGRPKRKRASEVIAEEAEKDAQKILKVLTDGIDPEQSISTRLKAAAQYLDIERDERRLEMDEDEHFEKMTRTQLAQAIAKKLEANPLIRDEFMARMRGDGLAPEEPKSDEDVIDGDIIPVGELESGNGDHSD